MLHGDNSFLEDQHAIYDLDGFALSSQNGLERLTEHCQPPGGGEVLPYMGYIGMCRCEGYGFQAVYSRIGYVNQSVWV